MAKWQLSKQSLKNREGVHPTLIKICDRALQLSHVDFGIPKLGGVRTFEQQRKLFNEKKTLCDGRFKISPHQKGYALDFFALINGKASWHPPALAMVACAFLQAATEFNEECVALDWGGLWKAKKKEDGVPYGWDCGHIQIMRENYAVLDSVPANGQINTQE